MNDAIRARRRMRLVMWLMALAVLVPSLYGFGTKFLEFVALSRGDAEGAFALSPIVNYLLASLGFLCLFVWAAMHGMFRDVEAPKYTLLENEAWLDGAAPWYREAGLTHARRLGDLHEHDR
jgi:hypothetical protein